MKHTKKELMNRIADLIEDEETKVSVLEDMEDSIIEETEETENVELEEIKKAYDELKAKYDELLVKYRDRFLKGDVIEEPKSIEDEYEEKEIVDVKEI